MNQALPGTIIFIGLLGLLAYWIACRSPLAKAPTNPDQTDYWTTPFYLRNNTAIFDGTAAIVPSYPDQPWSLATYYTE